MVSNRKFCILILLYHFPFSLFAQSLSPIDFGLYDARNDKERYQVLYRSHKEALKRGCDVRYDGIKEISIELTDESNSIPLTNNTDFADVKINVINNSHTMTLFLLSQRLDTITTTIKELNKRRFSKTSELCNGLKLLVIKDEKPWVENRRGFSYGAYREDILLIKNGRALNKPIFSYDDADSKPVYLFCDVSKDLKRINNITINRSPESTYITNCFKKVGQNNVLFSNITINTPEADYYADRAISVINSTNISFEDISINGTYSRKDKSGYGIYMYNTWNTHFYRVKAYGK